MRHRNIRLTSEPSFLFHLLLRQPSSANVFVRIHTGKAFRISRRNLQGPVAPSLVSANRWLRGIKTYRFPWYLALVSANHASSNPGQMLLNNIHSKAFFQQQLPLLNRRSWFVSTLSRGMKRQLRTLQRNV